MALTLGGSKLIRPGGLSEGEVTPLNYNRRMVQRWGSEDLIDAAELGQKNPRVFRDWQVIGELYKDRFLTGLSLMMTAAALNEINGALALLARCTRLVYSYEQQWSDQFQDVILTEWPEHSPTSIPQGISFLSYGSQARTTAYAALVSVPNALICDPNFGDSRMMHLFEGVNKTSAYTMQRRFASALAMRPFRNFIDRTLFLTEGQVPIEDLYDYWTRFAFQGLRNENMVMYAICKAADQFPPADTLVAPQGTEWTLLDQMIEVGMKYKLPILDLTDGDAGQAALDFSRMEHEPDGTFRKGIGRGGNLSLHKMPSFQAVAFASEEDGFQPLLRRLILAGAAVFPKPRFGTELLDGNAIAVTMLDMSRTDSENKKITLAEAIRASKCGLMFDGGEGEAAYNKMLAVPADPEERRVLADPTGYEIPSDEIKQSMRTAKKYTEVKHWRSRPIGANDEGHRARLVGHICEAQLPTKYLVEGARTLVRTTNAALPPGVDNSQRYAALDAALFSAFPGRSYNVDAVRAVRRVEENTEDDVKDTFANIITQLETGAPAPAYLASFLATALPDPLHPLLEQWGPALSALRSGFPAAARALHERLAQAPTDIAKIETHFLHALKQLESLGVKPSVTALPASFTDEHAQRFISSIPTPAALQQSKIVDRTDARLWSKALAAGAGIEQGAVPSAPADNVTISTSRAGALIPYMGSLMRGEFAVLAAIFAQPWNLDTAVRMAQVGIPVVTGHAERWAMTFHCLSALVLKSDEVCDTVLTPMRATVTSRGPRRITDFTFEFSMGQRWKNPDALRELPNLWANGVGGGFNTRFVSTHEQLAEIVNGENLGTRADVNFTPRCPGEETVQYPCNLMGWVWQKPDKMGVHSQQMIYHHHSGYVFARELIGKTTLDGLNAQLQIDLVLQSNGSVGVPIQLVVDRMATMRADDSGRLATPTNGTGPFGPMIMNHAGSEPHIKFGGRGLFGVEQGTVLTPVY